DIDPWQLDRLRSHPTFPLLGRHAQFPTRFFAPPRVDAPGPGHMNPSRVVGKRTARIPTRRAARWAVGGLLLAGALPSLYRSPVRESVDELLGRVGRAEGNDLDIHEAGVQTRLLCGRLGDRFDALRPDDPKRAVPPNALPQRRDLAQVLVGFRREVDLVGITHRAPRHGR